MIGPEIGQVLGRDFILNINFFPYYADPLVGEGPGTNPGRKVNVASQKPYPMSVSGADTGVFVCLALNFSEIQLLKRGTV